MPMGADSFQRGACAAAPRFSIASRRCCTIRDSAPPSATKADSPRSSKSAEDALGVDRAGRRRRPATSSARRSASRSTCAATEFYDEKQKRYVFKKSDGSASTAERDGRVTTRIWAKKYPDPLDRRRLRGERLGRLEEADRRDSANRRQLVGDDLFVTNVKFLQKGIEQGVANSHSRQGQPDRHADRNARRGRTGASQRLHRRDQPSLGRNRGRDHRRHRRRDKLPARSRPVRSAARTASRNTTNCSASKKTSGIAPSMAGKSRPEGAD